MNYGYAEYNSLTPNQILQKITQQQIFEFILKKPFSFKERYTSPFRTHSKKVGTCRFEEREDGTILWVDFGDQIQTHRTCFSMLAAIEKTTLNGAIDIICNHFKLSTNEADYKPIDSSSYSFTKDSHSNIKITFDSKPFEKHNKIYWSKFLITIEHLKEDSVYNVNKFHINRDGKVKTVKVFDLTHCYAIDFGHAVKLYQPYSKDYKFITDCSEDDIGNINNIEAKGKELLVSKAYKDHRVLRNLLNHPSVVWFHNEGCIPSKYILLNLLSRFDLITIFFDNDEAGTLAAMKLCDIFNEIKPDSTRMVQLPNYIKMKEDNYKDPSEMVSKEGRLDTTITLKQLLYGK